MLTGPEYRLLMWMKLHSDGRYTSLKHLLKLFGEDAVSDVITNNYVSLTKNKEKAQLNAKGKRELEEYRLEF